MAQKNKPLVVIFGRTNVGKSTLFNKLIEKNQALVSNIEGTTRDSNIGEVSWAGKTFELIDTGGIMDLKFLSGKKKATDDIEEKVQEQSRQALKRADIILFLVDCLSGMLPQDKQMSILLKKMFPKTNHIILAANKADKPSLRKETADFYKLSLGEPLPISAANGSGTGDLLDAIVKKLPKMEKKVEEKEKEEVEIKICILGQPNVGKSSLLNSILGQERIIVSPIPHTTREPQDTLISHGNVKIKLIDTAGISKKGQQKAYQKNELKTNLEKKGIAKSLKALDLSDLAFLMLDIDKPISRQDAKIASEIKDRKKSLIIIANKWDMIKEKDTDKFKKYIYAQLPFVGWAPIQFVSAKTGEKIQKILDLCIEIYEQRNKKITDSQLNSFLMKIVKRHKPAKGKGLKHPRIHGFKQEKTNPPIFNLRIGSKDNLHFSYVRFIENRLREKFGFLGTPLTINVVKNKATHGSHNR